MLKDNVLSCLTVTGASFNFKVEFTIHNKYVTVIVIQLYFVNPVATILLLRLVN